MTAQKKLLIVDDDEMNLDFFDLMLSKLGFGVIKAKDGVEALEKAKRFLPDLILLDNIMPRMDGWEFTKTIKSDDRYKDIPIIMFSALDDVKDKLEGFELGIEDYITKPFNFSEVLARIRVVLRNQELFTQIRVRESRLDLAEELNADMKKTLLSFVETINDLDKVMESAGANPQVAEKTQLVRKQIAELDARIEKTIAEWEDLKKAEIKLPVLETNYRKTIDQEAAQGK
ncbi:MAG: response regulator [Treponema sp.]|jgi:CheY-like chemotaxis protein|nr:response regulator [Treponema sp.]